MRIELFDEDQGKDEELGRLSVDLKLVQARGTVDKVSDCGPGSESDDKYCCMILSSNRMHSVQSPAFQWYPLEGCKHGDLHIKATWMNLSTDLKHLEKQEWEAEWGQADKPIHSALLMVYVDSVADLPVS